MFNRKYNEFFKILFHHFIFLFEEGYLLVFLTEKGFSLVFVGDCGKFWLCGGTEDVGGDRAGLTKTEQIGSASALICRVRRPSQTSLQDCITP